MWAGKGARAVQEVQWGWGMARDSAVQVEKGVHDVLRRPGRIYGSEVWVWKGMCSSGCSQIQKIWGGFVSRGDMR